MSILKNKRYTIYNKPYLSNQSCKPIVVLPRTADLAFMRGQGKLVPLDEIEGKVALEGALPYPPGVFIVAPGERWQALDAEYFKVLLWGNGKFPGF